MRPDSTSYPTLAAVDACGITDAKVVTQVYIWSGYIAHWMRTKDNVSCSGLLAQAEVLRELIGTDQLKELGRELGRNLRRSIKWCEENRK